MISGFVNEVESPDSEKRIEALKKMMYWMLDGIIGHNEASKLEMIKKRGKIMHNCGALVPLFFVIRCAAKR